MLNTRERLTKARIKLQSKNPFFSYLSLFLEFKEADDLPEWAGMGVDIKGTLSYKKEFVDKLTDDELLGVISHEVLHLAFLHLLRVGGRNQIGFNMACDLVINCVLEQNGFQLPKGCLIPEQYKDFSFSVGKKVIKDIDKKTAEKVYDELPKEQKQKQKGNYKVGGCSGFDEHKHGKKMTKEQENKLKEEWKEKLSNAYVNAKQRGELPRGIEQLIGELHKEKIDWRNMLRKYITSSIPTDYSWARRSKKSIASGFYLPDTIKEKVKVVIAIDTSGSISKKEMTDFISEIVGMARAYQNQIDMTLYTHDCEVQDCYEVRNGNIEKIMKLNIKGGGGTSHKPVIDRINKDIVDCNLAIFFTDGWSDTQHIDFSKNKFRSIFVITSDGTEDYIPNEVTTIKIE